MMLHFKDKQLANQLSQSLNCGYWEVNGIYFFHKAAALRYASSVGSIALYHFFDEVYDVQDWHNESSTTFDELCKLRAQQLRDKYKYLALSFSGGSDSTNVLETFLKNNIPLDEVISFFPIKDAENSIHTWSPEDNDAKNYAFEYVASVKPKLKWLSENFPKIKITIIDNSETSRQVIHDCKGHDVTLGGIITAPGLIAHIKCRDHMMQYGQDAALLYGVDKPRIGYDNTIKSFFTYFHDINTFLGNWSSKPGDFNKVEYFYHTYEMPQLMVKSTQMLKKALQPIVTNKSHPLYNEVVLPPKNPRFSIVDVHCDYVKKILYPNWNTNTFQVKKLSSFFWPEYTHYFFDNKKSIDFWNGQIEELVHNIDERFIERNSFGRADKLKDVFTRFIYL